MFKAPAKGFRLGFHFGLRFTESLLPLSHPGRTSEIPWPQEKRGSGEWGGTKWGGLPRLDGSTVGLFLSRSGHCSHKWWFILLGSESERVSWTENKADPSLEWSSSCTAQNSIESLLFSVSVSYARFKVLFYWATIWHYTLKKSDSDFIHTLKSTIMSWNFPEGVYVKTQNVWIRGTCDVMRGRVILGRYIPATWLTQGLQTIMAPRTTDYNPQPAGQPGITRGRGGQQSTSNTGWQKEKTGGIYVLCFGITWTSIFWQTVWIQLFKLTSQWFSSSFAHLTIENLSRHHTPHNLQSFFCQPSIKMSKKNVQAHVRTQQVIVRRIPIEWVVVLTFLTRRRHTTKSVIIHIADANKDVNWSDNSPHRLKMSLIFLWRCRETS